MLYTIKHFFRTNDTILNKNNILHYSFRLFLLYTKRSVANANQQNVNRQYNVQSV